MYLHEAIKQAGEGGKIRRPSWRGDKSYYLVGERALTHYRNDRCQGGITINTIEPLTTDDWEVVEEQTIEAGDTVESKHSSIHGKVKLVHGDKAYVDNGNPNLAIYCLNSITLIRKGKQHVFEGMEVAVKDDKITGPITLRTVANEGARYPWARLQGDGKTYDVTFKETEG